MKKVFLEKFNCFSKKIYVSTFIFLSGIMTTNSVINADISSKLQFDSSKNDSIISVGMKFLSALWSLALGVCVVYFAYTIFKTAVAFQTGDNQEKHQALSNCKKSVAGFLAVLGFKAILSLIEHSTGGFKPF